MNVGKTLACHPDEFLTEYERQQKMKALNTRMVRVTIVTMTRKSSGMMVLGAFLSRN